MKPLNEEQRRRLDAVLAYEADYREQHPQQRHPELTLEPGTTSYDHWAQLLSEAQVVPAALVGVQQLSSELLQEGLDLALNFEDVEAFYQALPWAQFAFQEHAGLDVNFKAGSPFTRFMTEQDYATHYPEDHRASPFHTFPPFCFQASATPINLVRLRHGGLLLGTLEHHGLLRSILPVPIWEHEVQALAPGKRAVTAHCCAECGTCLYYEAQGERVSYDPQRDQITSTVRLPWGHHRC